MPFNLPGLFVIAVFSLSFVGAGALANTDSRVKEIPWSQFNSRYTDKGVLYHGTSLPRYESMRTEGVRFMPNGMFGFYTTPEVEYASAHAFGYHGRQGVILPFLLQTENLRLRIAEELPGVEISAEEAFELGYDILVRPLPIGQVAFHTTGTKVIVLNIEILIQPSLAATFKLAVQQAAFKIETKVSALNQMLAPDALQARSGTSILPVAIADAIAEAKVKTRPLKQLSISNICRTAFED